MLFVEFASSQVTRIGLPTITAYHPYMSVQCTGTCNLHTFVDSLSLQLHQTQDNC